jgi:hypothetical protein
MSDDNKLPPLRRLRVPGGRPGGNPEATREAQGGRLIEARLKSRIKTASDAARSLGIAIPTYLAHENGTRQIRSDIAELYCREYGINIEWLLFGQGPRDRDGPATDPIPVPAPVGGGPRSDGSFSEVVEPWFDPPPRH